VIAAADAPEVLKLVGHNLRWNLIRRLAQSDYRVNELVDSVGQPQNLVSYHLRLLRDHDLVVERRSSADARDIYYHLDLDRLGLGLTDAAAVLHPSIASLSMEKTLNRSPKTRRILFICTGNSARSQMAEAILRHELGPTVEVYSAGPAPTEVNPLALQVLNDMGIDVTGLRSKGMDEVRAIDFDIVITLCDKAKEACPPDDSNATFVHWSLPDPALVKGSAVRRRRAFESTAAEIAIRVRHLIPVLKRQMEGQS
jgi:protein-tyrosine-phosphatase